MFQKGTGERFKYKAAVIEYYPKAVCKRSVLSGTVFYEVVQEISIEGGAILLGSIQRTAEAAWADVWVTKVKNRPKCGDIEISSGNSDAKCHRVRTCYAIRLVKAKPETCDGCVYSKVKNK